ncbi:MAG: NosD domain-containing protein [Promethearchaeota archaeon]
MRKKIKNQIYGIVYFIIISGIIGYFCYLGVLSTYPSKKYPSHGIYINSDNDLLEYGFPGSGTQSDPYIIEGYTILNYYAPYAIHIEAVSKFVIIQNNFLQAGGNAIEVILVGSHTIKIINNTCVGYLYSWEPHHTGLGIYNTDGCYICNNTCLNFYEGIELSHCDNCIIINNQLKDNGRNIVISSCSNINIANNSLIVYQKGGGYYYRTFLYYHDSLYIGDCKNISIKMNTFENSGLYFYNTNASSLNVQDNLVNGFELGYFIDENNLEINSSSIFGQLFFINCTNSIIRNQEIRASNNGIILINCLNFTISFCNCSNDFRGGISLRNSEKITISNSTFDNNDAGATVSYSDNIIILHNNFSNNIYGIYLIDSNCTYNENYFYNNTYDVRVS